ncbi:MAG: T9SS type A sorting domain-containing protein [Saprospiraceae bacterium]|nr:T9SS type A sorting domain-containing protein [Saprospiraceae bacterium]
MRLNFTLLLFVIFISLNTSQAQSYLEMIDKGTFSVFEIQDSAAAYFKDADKGRGTGFKQYKRWEYNALRMMDENGFLQTSAQQIRELERYQAELLRNATSRTRTEDNWIELGPNSWNQTSGWNPGIGRITGFAVDNNNENVMIVGAETGGVWKSEDAGNSWIPLSDYFSNLRVYSVSIHPHNSDIYYFGSSEGRIYKSPDAGSTWNFLGIAGTSTINKILINPENPDLMFASSQFSGFYRSENGGADWTKVTSDPSAFDIEFLPGDYNTVLASGSSFHRSFDGGASFTSIQVLQNLQILSPQSLSGSFVATENSFDPGKVEIPGFPEHITSTLGLFKDSAGDSNLGCSTASNPEELDGKIVLVRRGNCNFATKVLNAQAAGAIAVLIANNAGGAFAIGGGDENIAIPALAIDGSFGDGLKELIDSGIILEIRLQKPDATNIGNGPKMLAISPSNPNIMYLLEASGRVFGGLYKSIDGGVTFQKLDHAGKNYFGYSTGADDDRGQAPRNMDIAVHPQRPNEVHIAGILTWVSYDGGVTFEPTSDWIPNSAANQGIGYCHADVEFLDFIGNTLYVGSDGGIFKAENTESVSEAYYKDLTTGLGIRQFYKIGVSQTAAVVVSGGSQDNGTSLYTPDKGWIDWLGADGMETFVDKNDPDIIYGTSQYGSLYRSRNGGNSYSNLFTDVEGNWVTPFEQDPIAENTIYAGYNQVLKSEDQGSSWVPISPDFGVNLDHLKIAPANNKIMYAAHGNVLEKTTDGGETWESIPGIQGLINSIAVHPSYPEKIAIATTSANKVFISQNGGISWQNYKKNLPDFSALALVWQDGPEDGLYLGMNYGIYYIDNNTAEWLIYNNNLPNVIVNELEINYEEGLLYAATYGRGLWASPLFSGSTSTNEPELLAGTRLFPNPANSSISIEMAQNQMMKTDIRVFDSAGKLHRYYRDISTFPYQVDVSGLQAGMYYIKVNNSAGSVVRKLILQR